MQRAACRGDLHFTDRDHREQLATCRDCPVKGECLEYGLDQNPANPNMTTVYGGLLPDQLYKLALQRRRATHLPRTWIHRLERQHPVSEGDVSCVCEWCGEIFSAVRLVRWCSQTCRRSAYRDRQRQVEVAAACDR
jgi:hypothetical protein